MTYTLITHQDLFSLAFYDLAPLLTYLRKHDLTVYHVSRSPVGRHMFLTAR